VRWLQALNTAFAVENDMRKEYGKTLRELFATKMKLQFPQFEDVKVKSMYLWPGDRAYCWRASDRLHCWIVLSPGKKDSDKFMVLIGWSKQGRYPELSIVTCAESPTTNSEEFEN